MLGVSGLPPHADIDLLRAARAGDPEAFACFYRRYRDVVVAYLVRRTRRAELAADLATESFTAALVAVHREDFEEPRDPAAGLFSIAHHKLIDAYRRRRVEDRARRAAGIEPLVIHDVDLERVDALGDEDRVIALLEGLPADQRDAIRARILDEREYADISVDIQISPMVIRQRVSRGLRRLRDLLEASS
jgi:RNA polymerase sigma-70 factor (ECF subfamily)